MVRHTLREWKMYADWLTGQAVSLLVGFHTIEICPADLQPLLFSHVVGDLLSQFMFQVICFLFVGLC